jgi:hypothetical protein
MNERLIIDIFKLDIANRKRQMRKRVVEKIAKMNGS